MILSSADQQFCSRLLKRRISRLQKSFVPSILIASCSVDPHSAHQVTVDGTNLYITKLTIINLMSPGVFISAATLHRHFKHAYPKVNLTSLLSLVVFPRTAVQAVKTLDFVVIALLSTSAPRLQSTYFRSQIKVT